MANKVVFIDETCKGEFPSELQTFLNNDNRLYIEIKSGIDIHDIQYITIGIEDVKILLDIIKKEIDV